MFNFHYFTPTEVVFGRNAENHIGELIKKQGVGKVLIHYGSGSVVRSGLLDRIKSSLDDENIAYTELGGVVPNPRLSLVYKGIELCKKENVELILAVGGGSAIDSAKAIGYGAVNEGDVWDFYDGKRKATGCLPIGVVLTLSATGSEMSDSSVITKEEGWIKRGYSSDFGRPAFAVMNPELTLTLPDYQTACGCADILMHTIERYFTSGGNMEITDSIAEALMRTVIANAKILRDDPKNYEARAEIMWAGSLSHNGLTGCGNNGGDWATHKLEHEISGIFDVAHGAGLAAIWGAWARYTYKNCLDRFYKYAVNVMEIKEEGSKDEISLSGIKATENFFREINMPTSLSELKIYPTEEQILLMANKCALATNGSVGSARKLVESDMAAIYRSAK